MIVEKTWRRNDGNRESITYWSELLKSTPIASDIPTFLPTSNGVLVHIHRLSLFFLALVETDTQPLAVTEFLSTLADVLLNYFGELNEHAIKDNFITVYELLDEMLDNGFPMTTELDILRGLIRPPNVFHKIIDTFTGDYSTNSRIPTSHSSVVPWRRSGVKYAVNEVFVDILEEIDCITAPGSSSLVKGLVRGTVMVNSLLSGMPDLTMRLRGTQAISDVSLHPCVRYKRYMDDGSLSFIPPDGNFKLMTYVVRDSSRFALPVEIQATIGFNDDHTGSISVSVHPRVSPPVLPTRVSTPMQTPLQRGGTLLTKMLDSAAGLTANASNLNNVLENVSITIPFSPEVLSVSLNPSLGAVHFDARSGLCTWTVGGVPKAVVPRLIGNIELNPKALTPLSPPSVLAKFTVRGVAVTGMSVERLELGPSEQYRHYKGMKCLTKAGKYETRV